MLACQSAATSFLDGPNVNCPFVLESHTSSCTAFSCSAFLALFSLALFFLLLLFLVLFLVLLLLLQISFFSLSYVFVSFLFTCKIPSPHLKSNTYNNVTITRTRLATVGDGGRRSETHTLPSVLKAQGSMSTQECSAVAMPHSGERTLAKQRWRNNVGG